MNLGDDDSTKKTFERFVRIVKRHDRNRPDKSIPPLTEQEVLIRAQNKLYNHLMNKSSGISTMENNHAELQKHLEKINLTYEDIQDEAEAEMNKNERTLNFTPHTWFKYDGHIFCKFIACFMLILGTFALMYVALKIFCCYNRRILL